MEGTPKAKGGTPKAKGGTPKAEGGTPEGKEGPQKIEVAKGGDRVEDYPPIVRRAARERWGSKNISERYSPPNRSQAISTSGSIPFPYPRLRLGIGLGKSEDLEIWLGL
eukprot:1385927-Amorphochlora_amoeboformis.AAC.1